MIKLEAAHIEEIRGIRKLDIEFGQATFAISGPNGSGKSGVIDAIEFGLTGDIGRLTGRGTKGLSVSQHGPHVDKIDFPDAAFVRLNVFIPSLGKRATVTRKLSSPSKPVIEPKDQDVLDALAEVADHPEVTLARRDILRFILVEPSKRSEEIQAILKLEEIGQTRSALNTAQNRLGAELKGASSLVAVSQSTLLRHLGIGSNSKPELLEAVNRRRSTLGLPPLTELTRDGRLDEGIGQSDKLSQFNKASALRDLLALEETSMAIAPLVAADSKAIAAGIGQLERDPALLAALQRRVLLEKGLELVDGAHCPLCDHPWPDAEHLLSHLRTKLAKSESAGTLQTALLRHGAAISGHVDALIGLLRQAHRIARSENDMATVEAITAWGTDLGDLKATLASFDGLIGLGPRLAQQWYAPPAPASERLAMLRRTIEAKPDQSAAVEAQTFLTTAQLRLEDFRLAMRKAATAKTASELATLAYDAYCDAMEAELEALYADIQADFSAFYRQINQDDEAAFSAELKPSEGKVDLKVNFYERGLYPPGAYHSEGHQDGMGVCLYLALMKRLFGKDFTIALLDDVVMSVDAGHRYQFCRLLKTQFPDTQFVITTHDRLWAEQMRSAGLVTSKTSLAFHSWSVDTGPLVESNSDIWVDIEAALAKGKVETAAHGLRHHLEYVSRVLADQLGARPAFRADGSYELGDLLPSVLARTKELYGKAADAAQSWGSEDARQVTTTRKAELSASNGASSVEQWAVNKAVHYNEWASFGRHDFEPVVHSFKDLLDRFRCADCGSWLYVTPRGGRPEALRCQCAAINLNLNPRR